MRLPDATDAAFADVAGRRIHLFPMSALKGDFEATVREMALAVRRARHTAVLGSARDFSDAVLTHSRHPATAEPGVRGVGAAETVRLRGIA